MEALYVLLLSVFAYIVLFFLAKIMGYRELSELSFFDYVIGISIGSIAAELATNVNKSWWRGVLAMAVFALVEVLLSFLSRKSNKIREFIAGKPIILMRDGKIDKPSLAKARIDVNDLQSQAREQGYFDLADIDLAIMEKNGSISFLPIPEKAQLSPKDFNLMPQHTGLCVNLILDGKIIEDNLVYAKMTSKDLQNELKKRKLKAEDILLLTCDQSGNIEIFE